MSAQDAIAVFPNKEQFDIMNTLLAAIASDNGGIVPQNYKDIQMLNRLGLASKVFHVGGQIAVEKEQSITANVTGSITGATVDADTFIAKMGTVHTGVYEFTYNGAAWHLDGVAVDLTEYGITVTGTPAANDIIEVHETSATVVFDVVDFDKHHPADPNLEHSISLLCHDAQAAIPYNPTQALLAVRTGTLPAGDYYFEVDSTYDASYNSGYDYVGFTLAQTLPAGGQLMLGWGYNAQLSSAKISTYEKFSTTARESNVAITNSATGTKLGTITNGVVATTTVSDVVVAVNNASRARYGSNDVLSAVSQQWISSAAASGWHKQVNEFDRPQTTPTAGFLYGMDPAFVSILGNVKLRTAKNTVTEDGGYVDSTFLGWLPSMTELGFGANNSVYETSPDSSGNVTNTPFSLYKNASNADRIKRNSGTARYWWMRSPHPSTAGHERRVDTDGSLNAGHASDGHWVVPGLDII